MRIILDTNVLVSALLLPESVPSDVLKLVLTGALTIIYDNKILSEYVKVLPREKFKINKLLIEQIIDYIKTEGQFGLALPQNVKLIDAADQIFFDLFMTEKADYLITGNKKHFPKQKSIVTPREFLEILH